MKLCNFASWVVLDPAFICSEPHAHSNWLSTHMRWLVSTSPLCKPGSNTDVLQGMLAPPQEWAELAHRTSGSVSTNFLDIGKKILGVHSLGPTQKGLMSQCSVPNTHRSNKMQVFDSYVKVTNARSFHGGTRLFFCTPAWISINTT